MSRVFISHSRQDAELIGNVATLLRNIGETPVVMEYMPDSQDSIPPYGVIREEVAAADYVMLFKTDNALSSEYTKNWIIFEVGLTAATTKRLFVFERRGPPIQFPIPYVTDYMLFDPEEVSDVLRVQSIAKGMKEELTRKPKKKGNEGIGLLALFAPEFLVAFLILGGLATVLAGPIPITCVRCKSSYRYYAGIFSPFQCPVCLTPIDPSSELKTPSP